ncbi:YoaK family protein [Kitasatospora sp. NPDC101157]|uniref:YoaK family protein n=1 Tax=Kitasatospora sp. NPDC101157 TaxID=3364098 RepID=UPI00380B71D8
MTTPAADSRTAPPPPLPGPKIHDRHPLALALFGLTLVSGLIDAVSYLGLGHVFTANMTGNVVVIAFALAGAPGFSVTGSLTSLAAFLLGALLAGRIATRHAGTRRPAQLRTVFILEVALYGAAAAIVFVRNADGPGPAQYAVIALLALAMGIRNGTVRGLGVPDLTTTVLTLTLTGLAADSRLAGGSAPRRRRKLLSVATMLAGAAPGAVLVLHGQTAWALVASAVLAGGTLLLYRE